MKKFLIVLLSISCLFFCCSCKKVDNLESLSANLSKYEIQISLNSESMSAQAHEKFTYVNNTESVLKHLSFHLYPQFFEEGATDLIISSTHLNVAYPNGMDYGNFEVTRVIAGGTETPVKYTGEHEGILSVELPSSLIPGDSTLVEIDFEFKLPNCEHRFGYGDNTINLGNFYPILCVYENGGFNESGYVANGDPFYSEMANYEVSITLNRNLTVASTGEKINEHESNELKTISFKANMVRDFAMIISDKFEILTEKYEHTTVFYYGYDENSPEQFLKTGIDALSTFSEMIGNYPYSTLSIVKADFVHGGMEYPNLVMISNNIENADEYKNVIIHEIAHQWWYGMVGNDEINYPWLDEAITEFSTILFYDKNDGYNLNHSDMIKSNKENYSLFISVYEDVLGTIDTSMRPSNEYSTEPEYTYCTYVKGTLMFESLYQLMGEKAFINSLKEYFIANKYQNSNPEKMILSFEKCYKKDLTNFFESWLMGKVIIN